MWMVQSRQKTGPLPTKIQIQIQFYLHNVRKIYEGMRRGGEQSSTQRVGENPSLCVENQWSDAMRGSTPCHIEFLPFQHREKGETFSLHRDPTVQGDEKPCRVENQHDKWSIPLLHQNRKDSRWSFWVFLSVDRLETKIYGRTLYTCPVISYLSSISRLKRVPALLPQWCCFFSTRRDGGGLVSICLAIRMSW